MTLNEMKSCTVQTLSLFVESMPDVPFGEDDVEIEFTTKKNIVERFKALCAQYAPERPTPEEHCRQLKDTVFANAITGRGKSAVIVRIDYKMDEHNLRRILFHELMHIYCIKTEGAEDFIDSYGSGHTPDPNPVDKAYDGCVNAGYFVWSEFIAEYYAVLKTAPVKHCYDDIADCANALLSEAGAGDDNGKGAFSMAAAYILSSADVDEILDENAAPDIAEDVSRQDSATSRLVSCLRYLQEHIQSEQPCKITEEFIYELGYKYLLFAMSNSLLFGAM